GSASSSAWVAVFRLTFPPGAPGAGPPTPGTSPDPTPGGTATPIAISSPSDTLRARLTSDRSVPGNAPPAASMASATRAPTGRRTRPGRWTLPVTATTTAAGALSAAVGSGCSDALTTGATTSGRGRACQASTAAPPSTTT